MLFILIFFLAYHCLCSQNTNSEISNTRDIILTPESSGWNIGIGYKEQRLRIPEITFIKFSKNGKYIFTFSKDNIFRKWDTETGELINEKLFSYPNITNVFLDYDDRYLAVATEGSEDFVNDSLITFMYDYINDSLLYSFNTFVIDWSYPSDYSNTKIFFFFNSDKFLSSVDIFEDQGFGSYFDGRMDLWEKSSGNHLNNLDDIHSIYSAKISPDDKYLAITQQASGGSMHGGYYGWRQSKILYDNLSKSEVLIQEDSPSSNVSDAFLFTSDSKYLIGFSGNHKIFVRDIEGKKNIVSWSMSPIDSIYQITDIELSKDDKYLVTTSYDNSSIYTFYSSIRFWHLLGGIVVDSIIFNQSTKWLIDLSPDSISLVAGSTDGKIRLIQSLLLSNILKANFSTDTTVIFINQYVRFYDCSSGHLIKWEWNFGNGDTSSLQNPVLQYNNCGTYTVKLIVGDGMKSDTIIKYNYITVIDSLIADFDYSPKESEAPSEIQFEDKSKGQIISRNWDFGDNQNSTEQNPKHSYSIPTNYKVTLIVYDGYYSDTIYKYIQIKKQTIPIIQFENEFDIGLKRYYGSIKSQKGINGNDCKISDGYIMDAVWSVSSQNGSNSGKLVLKINENGDTAWTYNTGTIMTCESTDGCFISGASGGNGGYKGNELRVIKFYDNSKLIFDTLVGSPYDDDFWDIRANLDGGCIIIGNSYLEGCYVVKFNQDNTVKFQTNIPLKDSARVILGDVGKIINSRDSGYVILNKDRNTTNNYLTKISNEGEIIFQKIISDTIISTNIIQTHDNNYIICGYKKVNNANRGILKKFDMDGNYLWGNVSDSVNQQYFSLCELDNGCIAVTGDLYVKSGLLVFDSDGVLIKDLRFNQRNGIFYSISHTEDDGVFLVGKIYEPDMSYTYYVKTKPLAEYLSIIDNPNDSIKDEFNNITVHPNPSDNFITITYNIKEKSIIKYNLYDLLGNIIKEFYKVSESPGTHETSIELNGLSPGIYFLQFTINKETKVYKLQLL